MLHFQSRCFHLVRQNGPNSKVVNSDFCVPISVFLMRPFGQTIFFCTCSGHHFIEKLAERLVDFLRIDGFGEVEVGHDHVLGVADDVDDLGLLFPQLRRQKLARKMRLDDSWGGHLVDDLVSERNLGRTAMGDFQTCGVCP